MSNSAFSQTTLTLPVSLANGGTGAASAATARTNLGLVIGTNVQTYDTTLQSISSLGTAADKMLYTTGVDTWAEASLTAAGRAILDDADASAQRTTLGLVSGGTGDIWVEKAGDTMTGALNVNANLTVNSGGATGGVFAVKSDTNASLLVVDGANYTFDVAVDTATFTSTVESNMPMKIINTTNASDAHSGIYTKIQTGAATTQAVVLGQDNTDDTFKISNSSDFSANTMLLLDTSGNMRNPGYLRVGSTSAPTNTTAGDLTTVRLFADSADIGNVSNTELQYVNGVTSAIQTQLDNKQPLDSDLTTIAGLTATTDNFLVSNASAWASRTPAQVKTTLSLNSVENTALSTWAGTSSITTLGTIATGTWSATTIAVANGGTGQTSYTDGQLLIGNTTGNTLTKATLTGTANQVVVTNGGGTITLSTPQSIATASTPQFAGLGIGVAGGSTLTVQVQNGTLGIVNSTNAVTGYLTSVSGFVKLVAEKNDFSNTARPLIIATKASQAETARFDGSGNVTIGTAAIATSATDGFFYITSCAGTPSGTPTSYTGRTAMVYDTTNNKFYIYNGAWKSVTLA